MVRILIFGLLLIVNFILQSTVFSYIEIWQVAPNTALLIVVSYAMLRGDIEGAIIGFAAGLILDVMFGNIIGLYALLYAITGFLCGKPFKDFVRENYLLPVVLALVASLALETTAFGVHFVLRGNPYFMKYLQERIIPATVYTVLLMFPVYYLVYRLNARLERSGR